VNGIVRWFARNGVAANVLMALIVVIGLVTAIDIKKEVFPEFSSDTISVTVLYPGAAPEEVEEGVVIKIEERLQGLEGIKELRSRAQENRGSVFVEVRQGHDVARVLNDVKSRIDGIDTFPEETEEPVIEEVAVALQVIQVVIYGEAEERTLKVLGERMRDDLSALAEVSQVDLASTRPYEISIEVSEDALRRYELTFDQVASAVRRSSLDLPGGRIDSRAGEILLRGEGQAYRGAEFERIPLRTQTDGTRLTVGDVARVVDGFADSDIWSRFDGKPAVILQIYRTGDQSAIDVVAATRGYLDEIEASLPAGIQVATFRDDSEVLRARLSLLQKNGIAGFVLVFVVLALFLRLSLAAWVALGIPISFLGGLAVMPGLDVSINMISLFAFIVVLGIVVDDAIVVGENIYAHFQRGKDALEAAIVGTQEVLKPVVFAVLTTVAAFAPILNVTGTIGKFMRVIPLVVIATLLFSLVEGLLILPSHLSHARRKEDPEHPPVWRRVQKRVSDALKRFITERYQPLLDRAIEWRYLTVSLGVASLVLTAAFVAAGWIRFSFMPAIEADNVIVSLTMPQGTPSEVTSEIVRRIEVAALELEDEVEVDNGEVFRHILSSVGSQPFREGENRRFGNASRDFSAAHLGEVNAELIGAEDRSVGSKELAERWRELTGPVPEAVELTFTSSLFQSGNPIHVQLAGADTDKLRTVATRLKAELSGYPGVRDISDSFRAGKRELELRVTPEAEAAGLSQQALSRQVRQAFYGEEVQRIQRGRDEIKVMVRFPDAERRSLADLEGMRVRAPGGIEIPLVTAATTEMSRGPATIARTDRRRVLDVTADVDFDRGNSNEIIADLESNVLPALLADFPGVRYSFEGQQENQRETLDGLGRGFAIAILVIYGMLAIPFRSYSQPLIVMAAIPFGLVGAVAGHVLMGQDLAILSMFGIVALTGVVINDSLVLVDFINRYHQEGSSLREAIRLGGSARFRPILLTSLTTFAGLTPLLLERSLQAQFLVPMAISLAFGVLFATLITLLLVPALYSILEDVRERFSKAGAASGREDTAQAGGVDVATT